MEKNWGDTPSATLIIKVKIIIMVSYKKKIQPNCMYNNSFAKRNLCTGE